MPISSQSAHYITLAQLTLYPGSTYQRHGLVEPKNTPCLDSDKIYLVNPNNLFSTFNNKHNHQKCRKTFRMKKIKT